MDPAQAKMMLYFMPAMIMVFMLFLPSGLCLYMFTNSALTIAQQKMIERRLDARGAAAGPAEAEPPAEEAAPAKTKKSSNKSRRTRRGRA